jgi:hypothetical protein
LLTLQNNEDKRALPYPFTIEALTAPEARVLGTCTTGELRYSPAYHKPKAPLGGWLTGSEKKELSSLAKLLTKGLALDIITSESELCSYRT